MLIFLGGECNRGNLCPYRHEIIEESDIDEDEIDKINGEDKNENENELDEDNNVKNKE